MKIRNIIFVVAMFCLFSQVEAKMNDSIFGSDAPRLEVNHLILAKVNGKAISVVDVMKKLDMIFYRQFPEYANSIEARHKFYQVNWKDALSQLIDKELVLADAAETKMEISSGDIRQEMETMFGPNVIENLHDAGLTYDEAYKMISEEITIRRTVGFRVTSKTMRRLTPQALKDAYEEYAKNNIRSNQWIYNVVSVRDKNTKNGSETISKIHAFLVKEDLPLSKLSEKIKSANFPASSTVNVSEEFKHNDLEISDEYKEIVSKLQPGHYSDPISQKSRRDTSTIYRIFYLKEVIPGGVIPFNEVEKALKDRLFDKFMSEETEIYFTNLRKHFDVQESESSGTIPANFEPFILK